MLYPGKCTTTVVTLIIHDSTCSHLRKQRMKSWATASGPECRRNGRYVLLYSSIDRIPASSALSSTWAGRTYYEYMLQGLYRLLCVTRLKWRAILASEYSYQWQSLPFSLSCL